MVALVAALVAVLAGALAPGVADAHTITFAWQRVIADDGSGPVVHEVLPAALPFSDSQTATAGSMAAHPSTFTSTSATYSLTNSLLLIEWQNERPAGTGSASVARGYLSFQVDQAVDYVMDGAFATVDADGRQTDFFVELRNLNAASNLLKSEHQSTATPNESFTLLGAGGDTHNLTGGAATGTLLPGVEYALSYYAGIEAAPLAATGAATAAGYVSLMLVPEPGTGLLVGLGLAMLGARKRPR